MRQLLYRDSLGTLGSLGLLPLRVVMRAAFVIHGWPKIQNPTIGMPSEAGIPPAFHALAAVAEFGEKMASRSAFSRRSPHSVSPRQWAWRS
jgi:uncharacterized membrane protein YphA (DoxX/SURF4 family)